MLPCQAPWGSVAAMPQGKRRGFSSVKPTLRPISHFLLDLRCDADPLMDPAISNGRNQDFSLSKNLTEANQLPMPEHFPSLDQLITF
jgi:hypothetical protein